MKGLDVHNAIYEWNYSRQILQIRMMEAEGQKDKEKISNEIFGSEFLIAGFQFLLLVNAFLMRLKPEYLFFIFYTVYI